MTDILFRRHHRTCRNFFGRKHFGPTTSGRVDAQVSGTLIFRIREWFFSVVSRLDCVCWKEVHEEVVLEEVLAEVVVGVQCCLGEGRTVQTVLRAVVDWKWEGAGTTNMVVTWLTWRWILSNAQRWYKSTILTWATSTHSHSCVLVNRLCVRHARCGCVFCVHLPSNCRYCVPAIRNPTVQHAMTEKILIHCSSMPPPWLPLPNGILVWCWRWRRSMRQVSLLLLIPPTSDQQRSHVLQINEIVDSDFDMA